MTHKLTIELNKAEIHQAITDYALKNVDLGVPFNNDDVYIGRLSVADAYLEIVPGRASKQDNTVISYPYVRPEIYVRPETIDEDVPF